MSKYILAIDQGTTGTTVVLVNEQAEIVESADQDFEQIYPKPGWVEHNPEHIWKTAVDCIQTVLQKSNVDPREIASIGITNQRETVLLWDRKDSTPVYNAIVWQCRRTTDYCQKLKNRGYEKKIRAKTGLLLDPYFSGTKIRWVLDNVSGAKQKAKQGHLAAGTIDTFLIWKLTAGASHVTDVSNASRTLLMNIEDLEWDPSLLKIFEVPESLLPKILPSSADFGVTQGVPGLPDGIPITGVAGDQQAALFGQACYDVGSAKCTFGTGSFLLMNTGPKRVTSKAGLLTTVAWQLKGEKKATYALEGGAFICGAAVQFLRDQMHFIKEAREVEDLASRVTDTGGVEFVPALTGLGAPYWDPEARGLIAGLTRGTTREQIARATLEAMALQNADILMAMQKDSGKRLRVVKVDGGASANNLLMQLQSDYLGVPIERPKNIESTSMGAAFLAGLGVGVWSDLNAIRKIWQLDKKFEAKMGEKLKRERMQRWHLAVERARLKN